MSHINALATIVPTNRVTNEAALTFMSDQLPAAELVAKRQLAFIYRKSKIQSRFSVIPDFSNGHRSLFELSNTQPNVEQRLDIFNAEGLTLALEVAKMALHNTDPQSITHIITVSCTGMTAPGLEIWLMERLDLATNIQRLAINFMGCYAGIIALRQADQICRVDRAARVLIVDIELCSLHFQNSTSPDLMMANALFGDGAAATIVSNEKKDTSWKLEDFQSMLVSKGKHDMAWEISPNGFLMKLSSYIPDLLSESIDDLINPILAKNALEKDKIAWGIHPGGRRILEKLSEALALPDDALSHSYETLFNYGNMSSATIFFVLEKLFKDKSLDKDSILAAAFGPGLSLESALITRC